MNKINKLKTLLLVTAVLLLLCACGSREAATQGNANATVAPTPAATQTAEAAQEGAETEAPKPQSSVSPKTQEPRQTTTKPQVSGGGAAKKNIEEAAPAKTDSQPPQAAAEEKPAASAKTEEPQAVPLKKTVSISIADGGNYILGNMVAEFEDGDTVYDILKRQTRANKIQMEVRGGGSNIYVAGINNLYEFDEGPESGWLYSVNGKFMSMSCSAYKVRQGDVIAWRYTRSLGKDVGAGKY